MLRGEFVRENLEALDALARKTATGVPGDRRLRRSQRRRAAQRGRRCCATARSSRATTRCSSRTSASSTSSATSCPAPAGTRVEIGGLTCGLSVCEDAWHDAPAVRGLRGPAADRQHQRVAVPPGQDRRARATILAREGAADRRLDRVRERGRRPGRARLRRRLDDGRPRRHGPPSGDDVRARTCSIVDLHGDTSFADPRPAWPTERRRGGLAGARARPRRLRAQERLPRGGARALGRHRLRADGRARGRRARRRRRARRSRCRRRTARRRASTTPSTARKRLGMRIDTVEITKVLDAYRYALAELFAGGART